MAIMGLVTRLQSPEKIENMHVIKINNQVPVRDGKDYYFTYEEQFGKNEILVDLKSQKHPNLQFQLSHVFDIDSPKVSMNEET